jgi:hypothetical protein
MGDEDEMRWRMDEVWLMSAIGGWLGWFGEAHT